MTPEVRRCRSGFSVLPAWVGPVPGWSPPHAPMGRAGHGQNLCAPAELQVLGLPPFWGDPRGLSTEARWLQRWASRAQVSHQVPNFSAPLAGTLKAGGGCSGRNGQAFLGEVTPSGGRMGQT